MATTATRERPIPFSAPMVGALLAGRKTQTRRVVKPQPISHADTPNIVEWFDPRRGCPDLMWELHERPVDLINRCPYGQTGDHLWVREALRVHRRFDRKSLSEIGWAHPHYEADGNAQFDFYGRLRPGRFVPRRYARIVLEITAVRLERLQAITRADARAEGISEYFADMGMIGDLQAVDEWRNRSTVENFAFLWDRLNAKRGHPWESNPFVWVIAFKQLEA
jgi:hypothetical protein